MRKRLWDLAKSRIEIGTILPGHRHKVAKQRDLGGAWGGATCARGAPRRGWPRADGPSRGARPVGVALTRRARPPASFPAGPRTVCRESRHSKQLPSFLPLFERCCCTPSPPVILEAPDLPRRELDRDPDDRPQVADRGRRSRCFSAPGSQRAPAALSRRVTAADIMCSVVPAGAELRHVEFFGGSTAGAPALASYAPHAQYSPRARPTK